LAREYKLTVYDAIYIALALENGVGIFTADESIIKVANTLGLSSPPDKS